MADTSLEVVPDYVARAKEQSYAFMNPERWTVMNKMAETFIASGALPASIKNAPQLIMVMQAGYEAGLQPMEAIRSFYFVNGKLSMYGEVAIAKVLNAGHTITWGICNEETATITIVRKDTGATDTKTFTMEMAKKRGLTSKGGPWISAPDNMLRFKAFWGVARFLVSDALNGMEIKEVLEGEVVVEEEKPVNKVTKVKEPVTIHLPEGFRTPLAEAIEAKEEPVAEPVVEEKPKSAARKKMEEGIESAKKDQQLTKELASKRYKELTDKEDAGLDLTAGEMSFMKAYALGEI